ncbi:MAG: ribonuclease III [Acidobacteria bacterium]|nr:ribonuclease III [Acidobacteriota bacterium]
MTELAVIFRTHSDIEASIVRGLLEAHGIQSLVSSDVPHSVFPLTIDGLGEVRISVRAGEADAAKRLIESYREDVCSGKVVRLRDEFDDLQKRIGYRFRDRGLLEHALTHRSRAHEDASGGVTDNESLEFLGDAVLGFVVADLLFRDFPLFDEGQKSKLKASLVSMQSLARLAEALELGEHMLLGRGEEKSGGRRKQALIADTYEALIAAIYLDGGLDAARGFIARELRDFIEEVHRTGGVTVTVDSKSGLQEWLQSQDKSLPDYRLVAETGPDHRKLFAVEVWVDHRPIAHAEGRSKKEAEQNAAHRALDRLKREDAKDRRGADGE